MVCDADFVNQAIAWLVSWKSYITLALNYAGKRNFRLSPGGGGGGGH